MQVTVKVTWRPLLKLVPQVPAETFMVWIAMGWVRGRRWGAGQLSSSEQSWQSGGFFLDLQLPRAKAQQPSGLHPL